MKKLFYLNISILIFAFSIHCFSQSESTSIYFQFNVKNFDDFEIFSSGLNFETKPIAFKQSIKEIDSASVTLPSNYFYLIGDGYRGHLIFLSNNEKNIQLQLTKIKNLENKIIHKKISFVFNNLSVKAAKYKGNLTFFDQLDTSFKIQKYNPQKKVSALIYKQQCDDSYKKSIFLLDSYHLKGLTSSDFDSLAKIEIEARYILNLCAILYYIPRYDLPKNFFDNMKDFNLNNSEYALKIPSYITACSVANIYYYNNFPVDDDYANFSGEFNSAQTKFDSIIKDRLMGWSIEDNMEHRPFEVDSLYKIFLSECKDLRIKEEVRKKVETFYADQSTKKPYQQMIDSIIVEDINGNKLLLKTIFDSSKLVLLDCWATWCMPCLKQKQFLKPLEEKYKDILQVVYISIDENKSKWKNYLKLQTSNEKNYLIDKEFDNALFKFFNVTSIPRFVLLNKSGSNVLKDQMPLPEYKDNFKYSLKAVLITSGNFNGKLINDKRFN